jgi:hypothetical protein
MTSAEGSMLPLVGALIFTSLVVVALAIDIALLHSAYLDVGSEADIAAEYGAAMIDVAAMHDGSLRLDPERARSAATTSVSDGSRVVSLDVTDSAICVTVGRQHRTRALTLVGMRDIDIRVRSCASPAAG